MYEPWRQRTVKTVKFALVIVRLYVCLTEHLHISTYFICIIYPTHCSQVDISHKIANARPFAAYIKSLAKV